MTKGGKWNGNGREIYFQFPDIVNFTLGKGSGFLNIKVWTFPNWRGYCGVSQFQTLKCNCFLLKL